MSKHRWWLWMLWMLAVVSCIAWWATYRWARAPYQVSHEQKLGAETTKVVKPAKVENTAPKQVYDPSHDRIWTSMVPGEDYIRNSPSKAGTVEFLQRDDLTQITVPAPATGIVSSIKNEKNYTALTLSDEKGKVYHYRFSKVMMKTEQKVTKGEILGSRPGVVRLPVTLIGPGDNPLDPRPFLPPIKELPPDADKPE